jgi:hypothetical protein
MNPSVTKTAMQNENICMASAWQWLTETRSILARSMIRQAGRFREDNDHVIVAPAGLRHDNWESGSSARASVMCVCFSLDNHRFADIARASLNICRNQTSASRPFSPQ